MDDGKMSENALRQYQSNYTITPEQFEKLYLSPKGDVAGDLRKTFGNPTPIAVMGFIMALMPISIALMGWRGSGGLGIATTTVSIWFGGILLLLAGLLEFFLGNTFPSVVFLGYGAHFLTIACAYIPWFNAVAALSATGTSQTPSPEFLSSFSFYFMCMCVLSFVFFLASLRTNLVLALVLLCATLGFGLLTGGLFKLADGEMVLGEKLVYATGATFFTACLLGWYLLLSIMLSVMDLPSPPVFDLSTKIRGVSERRKRDYKDE